MFAPSRFSSLPSRRRVRRCRVCRRRVFRSRPPSPWSRSSPLSSRHSFSTCSFHAPGELCVQGSSERGSDASVSPASVGGTPEPSAHGPSVREPCSCARHEHGQIGCGQNDRGSCGRATVDRATVGCATVGCASVGGMAVGCAVAGCCSPGSRAADPGIDVPSLGPGCNRGL